MIYIQSGHLYVSGRGTVRSAQLVSSVVNTGTVGTTKVHICGYCKKALPCKFSLYRDIRSHRSEEVDGMLEMMDFIF